MTMSLIAGVAAFVLTVLAMPHFITYYKIKKIGGQQMHEDVKQHLAKAGTPTMGGTVFLVVAILVSLIFNFHVFSEGHQAYGATVGILFVILIYGIIGFLDDFLKIFRQINEGLKPWQKMALQIIAGLLFYFIHVLPSGTDSLAIGGLTIHLGVFYVLFVLFWIVGFSNAVNLTDGIDGFPGKPLLHGRVGPDVARRGVAAERGIAAHDPFAFGVDDRRAVAHGDGIDRPAEILRPGGDPALF